MFSGDQTVSEGSIAIVYEDHKNMSALRVQAGQTLQNRFGAFPHSAMIGKRFGDSNARCCPSAG